jgi:hypothetical protein
MAVARLQGRIEERRTRPGARVEAHHVDRTFLDGATTTAEQLRRGASEELLQELNTEIRSIAGSLGIPNPEEVAVLLNATMRVVIGGQPTNFARLTGGERLRLRIATVVAMLRIGERRGVGRHPGLIS